MRQSSSRTGAKGTVSGSVSNVASWIEQFQISQNDLPIEDADTSTWRFTFGRCEGRSASTSATLTLTSGAEITVQQATTATLFGIEASIPTGMCGDYHADLIETRADGLTVHWLHGVVTFNS